MPITGFDPHGLAPKFSFRFFHLLPKILVLHNTTTIRMLNKFFNSHGEKRDFPKYYFPENTTEIAILSKILPRTIILVQHRFSTESTESQLRQHFRNPYFFYQYLFNSRSNMNMNLVYWNSLHQKKTKLHTFSGKTPFCF